MEISLDDINNDDMVCGFQTLETEAKTVDPFCFNGRNVMTSLLIHKLMKKLCG